MKVLALVASCRDCPRRVYYSGGQYECAAAQVRLPSGPEAPAIPAWCPLAEYPAAEMNRLMDENAALRRSLAEMQALGTPASA